MLKRYLSNSSGNIAVITALTMGLMIMGAGVAIDYSGSTSEYARMQTALDSAVLAAATKENSSNGQLKQTVKKTVRQNFKPSKAGDAGSLDINVDIVNDKIIASVSLDYSTSIMGMFGRPTMPLYVESGGPRRRVPTLNVALVVDTTDSMSGSNMADLQAAADELIDTFIDTGADIRMSLVPYAQYVNVGMGKQNANWVDASKTSTRDPAYLHTYTTHSGGSAPVCSPTGLMIPVYGSEDGVVVQTGETPEMNCTGAVPGTPSGTATTEREGTDREFEFNGCMGSRDDPENLQPAAGPSNRIPAAMNVVRRRSVAMDNSVGAWGPPPATASYSTKCGQVLTPLTDDLEVIRGRVQSLTTEGETYLPAGLIWGWRTLSPTVPYTQASIDADERNARSVMIFMTDGENSAYKSAEYHKRAGLNPTAARKGLDVASLLCDGIKADGIEVFTVAYNLPGSTVLGGGETETALQNCATSVANAFTPDTRDELIENFRMITSSLAEVKLDY